MAETLPGRVPAEIDASQFRSLAQLLEHSFHTYADRRAFVCMDKAITYGELDHMSAHFAAWLQSRGLRPGARVAIMMPNVLQYPVVLAAVLRAGFVVVNVNPLYTPRELEHQLKDSGAEAIVILENFATTLQQVLARTPVKHVVVASMGDLLGGVKGAIVNSWCATSRRWCGVGAAQLRALQCRAGRRAQADAAAGHERP